MSYTRATRTNSPELVGQYLDTELLKIETEILYPTVRGVAFEALSAKPDKYREGTLAYGLAGVFGGQEGLYIYDGSGNWRKL